MKKKKRGNSRKTALKEEGKRKEKAELPYETTSAMALKRIKEIGKPPRA